MSNYWYDKIIVYALDVKSFMDSNGDGIGDFKGLSNQLDYLSCLGINCLWLRPFYPSPLADDGYDVMNYFDTDSRFGNLGEFVDFVKEADMRGIKVIIDLVINHTSNRHPWFLESKKNKNSKYYHYYIWSKEPRKEYKQKNILGQEGIWHYDEEAKEYYLHHFLKEQPDLNVSNPQVRKEIKQIMSFWLQLGIAGFRIDAAHVLVQKADNFFKEQVEVLHILEDLRSFLDSRSSSAVLLAEANVPNEELAMFFHSGSRMHLLFNFISNKNLFLCMAKESPTPLINALNKMKTIEGRWVNFLRHHDELNLEMLNEQEREEVFKAFAPEENMRLFGHGIRRRLPPMLDNNRQKLEFIYSVMFALPGIPMLNYGEEIGMGDDLSQPGRHSVRTVMQWDDTPNAGFSTADVLQIEHSVISEGVYSFEKVNVALQQKDPNSFLSCMQKLINARKQCSILSSGKWGFIETGNESVMAIICSRDNETVFTIHNFSSQDQKVQLHFKEESMQFFVEIFSSFKNNKLNKLMNDFELEPFGYSWFRCTRSVEIE
jgi:maltose alpha-D-glucosyltransferase / alpha-amylase